MKTASLRNQVCARPARLIYLFIFQTFVLYGCSSIYLRSTVVSMEPLKCNVTSFPNQIYTFWESDKIDFPYQRIGLIEVTGKPETSFEDLHDNLLFQARKVCANALIHVYEEPVFIWSSNLQLHEKKIKIVGIAVLVDENTAFKEKHAIKMYDNILERMQQKKRDRNDPIASFFLSTLYLSLMCMVILFGLNEDTD